MDLKKMSTFDFQWPPHVNQIEAENLRYNSALHASRNFFYLVSPEILPKKNFWRGWFVKEIKIGLIAVTTKYSMFVQYFIVQT